MKMVFKKTLLLALAVVLTLSLGATAFAANYDDMPAKDNWAYEALNAAVENGLIKGDDNGKLNPTGNLTRAEMAAVINRAFGSTETAVISFTDVPKSAWYYVDIAKAVLMGTFQGDGNAMRPNDPITRQEAFTVLARSILLENGDVSALNKFSDAASVASWAASSVAAMADAGYVSGADGKLNPTATITRQEFAQVMFNVIKKYVSAEQTVSEASTGNVMINAPGVTLKGFTAAGDVILGDGVGAGDATLDGVKIPGRLVVRGGGANSVKINNSEIGQIVIGKHAVGGVRVAIGEGITIPNVTSVAGNVGDILLDGKVTKLDVTGKSTIYVYGDIDTIYISAAAKGSRIIIVKSGKVGKIIVDGEECTISGEGELSEVQVNANNCQIEVEGANVTVAEGVNGTIAGGEAVESGFSKLIEIVSEIIGGASSVINRDDSKDAIDRIIRTACDKINTAFTVQSFGVKGRFVVFTPTLSGGIINVAWPNVDDAVAERFDDVGSVRDYLNTIPTASDSDVEKAVLSSLEAALTAIVDASQYVDSITAGGKTLTLGSVSKRDAMGFVNGMTFRNVKITEDTKTTELPLYLSFALATKNGRNYTYNIDAHFTGLLR